MLHHGANHSEADYLFERGLDCAAGLYGSRDVVAAHKWFNLAASIGDSRAREARAELAREMTTSEIVAAQREAREWRRYH